MTKLYNTQGDIVKNISKFLVKCNPNIRKTQLKIIPNIVFGMIVSESVCSSDIAKKLKNEFSLVQLESVTKRIKRFFKNKLFNSYDFYDSIIREVISSFKSKHSDKRVHIAFDHMFSHNNYVVFMITMRIGKQGIPLSMYSLACFSVLFLTIIGADFSKNTKCYKFVKITTHKSIHGKKTRIMSLFNVSLTLYNRAHNSCRYIRIPFTFKLYDI